MFDVLEQAPGARNDQQAHGLAVQLGQSIWGIDLRSHQREAGFYLDFYTAKTDALDLGRVWPATHRDVVSIISFVKKGRDQSLSELQMDLRNLTPRPGWLKTGDEDAAHHAIAFGASLWLFLDVSGWEKDESLCSFGRRVYSISTGPNPNRFSDVLVHFNARMLSTIGGVDLVWTSNLREHLRLDLVDSKTPQLFLFRHASYLGSRIHSGEQGTTRSPSCQL
jgi:hypothetical protein